VSTIGSNDNNTTIIGTSAAAASTGFPQFSPFDGTSNLRRLIGPTATVPLPPLSLMPNFYTFLLFHRLFGLSQMNGNGQNNKRIMDNNNNSNTSMPITCVSQPSSERQ
jgi:hypothetical protein